MTEQIQIGDLVVDVIFKDIKNVHLSVHPPTGRVRIAAPKRMKLDTIRVYAISKIDWIKKHQKKLQGQERETPREYLDRESHYVWGKRYLLKVIEADQVPTIELRYTQMILTVRPKSGLVKRESVVSAWYREEVRRESLPLIEKWEKLLGVKASQCYIQRMKTKWGSCNPSTRSIRLNSDLGKKPRECLEYIIVHELVHLLEPSHNARFTALMEKSMPNWKHYREELNRIPLSHVDWEY
jgi:predicted metal-dependent hydrolase